MITARGRLLIGMLLVLAGFTLAVRQGHGARAQTSQTVTMVSISYQPNDVTITTGGTVTWSNADDGTPHTVTAADGSFDSGILQMGDSFSFSFSTAGDYAYSCNVHPSLMMGVVHVVDGG